MINAKAAKSRQRKRKKLWQMLRWILELVLTGIIQEIIHNIIELLMGG